MQLSRCAVLIVSAIISINICAGQMGRQSKTHSRFKSRQISLNELTQQIINSNFPTTNLTPMSEENNNTTDSLLMEDIDEAIEDGLAQCDCVNTQQGTCQTAETTVCGTVQTLTVCETTTQTCCKTGKQTCDTTTAASNCELTTAKTCDTTESKLCDTTKLKTCKMTEVISYTTPNNPCTNNFDKIRASSKPKSTTVKCKSTTQQKLPPCDAGEKEKEPASTTDPCNSQEQDMETGVKSTEKNPGSTKRTRVVCTDTLNKFSATNLPQTTVTTDAEKCATPTGELTTTKPGNAPLTSTQAAASNNNPMSTVKTGPMQTTSCSTAKDATATKAETTCTTGKTTGAVNRNDLTTDCDCIVENNRANPVNQEYPNWEVYYGVNNELEKMGSNLQEASKEWYHKVRLNCMHNWETVREMFEDNCKALNQWHMALLGLINNMFEEKEGVAYDDYKASSNKNLSTTVFPMKSIKTRFPTSMNMMSSTQSTTQLSWSKCPTALESKYVRENNKKSREWKPELNPMDSEITSRCISAISLVEDLRSYWKDAVLECLKRNLKSIKEEEKEARELEGKIAKVISKGPLCYTGKCKCLEGDEKKICLKRGTDKLKNKLSDLEKELKEKYINHKVRNVEIGMGLDICRKVGEIYDKTMQSELDKIETSYYSTAKKKTGQDYDYADDIIN